MIGMRGREITIPRAFWELHGERSTAFDLALVYGTAIAFGILALLFAQSRVTVLPWWKSVILFLVAADASGGIVANFSSGTDRYYTARPGHRWAFIFLHFIEPALLYLLFDGRLAYWTFLYVYTVAAASLVNVIRDRGRQEVTAAALVALGILILLPLSLDAPFLAWFAPIDMIKLICAFAVRRT
jgi:hypothetical protein